MRPCGHAELDIWSEASADNCPQERSCSKFCRNKFQKHPTFMKPMATGKFSSHPLKEKKKKKKKFKQPQDKLLSIPNYYRRNANQNDKKKSYPI